LDHNIYPDEIERVLYYEKAVRRSVKALGAKIAEDYYGRTPVVICVLKGACLFFADLVKAMKIPLHTDFMIAKSYGDKAVSSGKLNIIKDIDTDMQGRHVLVADDIIDTGLTLSLITKNLIDRGAASVKTAVLLDKAMARTENFNPDYRCFEVGNEFIVGYGMDYAERFRNLPYIAVLKESVYTK
jgi:hypoxanthine phosphoribosyltransferase